MRTLACGGEVKSGRWIKFKWYLDPTIGIVDQHIQTPVLFPVYLLKQASHFTLLA
jgi:hypothetical protein